MLGPSQGALSGSGWTSINIPATPMLAAAFARTGTNSLWPPLHVPWAPGSCTECVASNTTGWPVRFIISRERISTTRLPYPKEVPRSHKEMLSFPAAFAFFRILAISQGARNWPFFMLTGFPVAATASMRSSGGKGTLVSGAYRQPPPLAQPVPGCEHP